MNKLIVVNKGHAGVGKSSSIKLVFEKLKALPSSVVNVIHDDGDITATIEVNGTVVGIESQGDPNSRMFKTLPELVVRGCEIIVCACRTSGATKKIVSSLKKEGFDIIWTSNPHNKNLSKELNSMWANLVVDIIERRVNGI